jgi:L-ascorbate metabolism protein UlaG (beta-lactamase superfamily)
MAEQAFEKDILPTAVGDLTITFLGHGSLLFEFNQQRIYVDPYGQVADYAKLPPADLVLVTHEHGDHLDARALAAIRTQQTHLVGNPAAANAVSGCHAISNGEQVVINGILIEATPAYNVVHKRENGQPFHPKGSGNGYVLTFGDVRVYVAGDTEDIPEMKDLQDIDVAFLPMNLPYTMTPEMAARAAGMFRPKIVYPYHFGSSDTEKLVKLLGDEDWVEVRVRQMA